VGAEAWGGTASLPLCGMERGQFGEVVGLVVSSLHAGWGATSAEGGLRTGVGFDR